MLGIYVIEKILQTQTYDKLFKINKKWLTTDLELRVYNTVLDYYQAYGSLPKSLKKLNLVPEEIFKNYDEYANFDFYFNALLDRYARDLYSKIKTLRPLNESTENIKQFLLDVYNEIHEYINANRNTDMISYLSAQEIFNKVKEELQKFTLNYITGSNIATGFEYLDRVLDGGYTQSEVYVYVARLKMGKTMYLLRSALSALFQHKKILFVSMEMDFFQIMRRLLALYYKDKSFLTHMVMAKKQTMQFLEKDFNKHFNFNYLNGMTLKNVYQLESYINMHRYDIVFIDGAYLIDVDKNYRADWERVKRVIETLKEIAMKHRIPIVCTYQFNRAALSTPNPDVEHIAYSDAIAQTAGAVIGILKKQNENQFTQSNKNQSKKKEKNEIIKTEEIDKKIKIFRVLANRYGPAIEFLVHFDFDNMNFDAVEGQKIKELEEDSDTDIRDFVDWEVV